MRKTMCVKLDIHSFLGASFILNIIHNLNFNQKPARVGLVGKVLHQGIKDRIELLLRISIYLFQYISHY